MDFYYQIFVDENFKEAKFSFNYFTFGYFSATVKSNTDFKALDLLKFFITAKYSCLNMLYL